jgi:hypothetical protein
MDKINTFLLAEVMCELIGRKGMDIVLMPINKKYAYANSYTIDVFPAFRPNNCGPKHRE